MTIAQRRLGHYAKRFGARQCELAAAAALPVVLDPQFVHLLRVNFFLDGNRLPDTAEVDLLISPLCTDLGDGLYEMDPTLRGLLLKRLCLEPDAHVRDVASLLWHYTTSHRPPWTDQPGLVRAQQLSALQFLDPEGCARWFAEADLTARGNDQRNWYIALQSKLEPGHAAVAWHRQFPEIRARGQQLTLRCHRAIAFASRMWRDVEDLHLPLETKDLLTQANILHVGELVQKTESEMARMGLNSRILAELRSELEGLGLSFGMRLESWPEHDSAPLTRVLNELESGLAYVDEASFERTTTEFEEAMAGLLVTTAPLVGFEEQVQAANASGWRSSPGHLAIVGKTGFGHEWLACRLLEGANGRLTLANDRAPVRDPAVGFLPDLRTFTEAQVRSWFSRHRLLFDEGDVLHLDVVNQITIRLWDSTPALFFDAVCDAAGVSRTVIERHRRRHFERVVDLRDPFDAHFVGRVQNGRGLESVAYLIQPNLAVTAGQFKTEERCTLEIGGRTHAAEVVLVEEDGEVVLLQFVPPADATVKIPPLAPTLIMAAPASVVGSRGEVADCVFTSSDTVTLRRPEALNAPYSGSPIVQDDYTLAHVVHLSENAARFCPAFLVAMHAHGAARLADVLAVLSQGGDADEVRTSLGKLGLQTEDVRRLWASSKPDRRWAALVAIGGAGLIACEDIVNEALAQGSKEERAEAALAREALHQEGTSRQPLPTRAEVSSSELPYAYTAEQQTIIDLALAAILAQSPGMTFVHGRELRHGLKHTPRDERDARIQACVPHLLVPQATSDESYILSLDGLLIASDPRPTPLLQSMLGLIAERYDNAPGGRRQRSFRWSDVRSRGGHAEADYPLAWHTFRISGLGSSGRPPLGAAQEIGQPGYDYDFWIDERDLESIADNRTVAQWAALRRKLAADSALRQATGAAAAVRDDAGASAGSRMPLVSPALSSITDLAVCSSAPHSILVATEQGSVYLFADAKTPTDVTWSCHGGALRVGWVGQQPIAWNLDQTSGQLWILGVGGRILRQHAIPSPADVVPYEDGIFVASSAVRLSHYEVASDGTYSRDVRQVPAPGGYEPGSLTVSSAGVVALRSGGALQLQTSASRTWIDVRGGETPALSPSGALLATSSSYEDGSHVHVFAIASSEAALETPYPLRAMPEPVTSLQWSLDDGLLMVYSRTGDVRVFHRHGWQAGLWTSSAIRPRFHPSGVLTIPATRDRVVLHSPRGVHSRTWSRVRSSPLPATFEISGNDDIRRGDKIVVFGKRPCIHPTAIYEVETGPRKDDDAREQAHTPVSCRLRVAFPEMPKELLNAHAATLASFSAAIEVDATAARVLFDLLLNDHPSAREQMRMYLAPPTTSEAEALPPIETAPATPLNVSNVNVDHFVEAALEASIIASPNMPGLTDDQLASAGRLFGLERGEVLDAVERSGRRGEVEIVERRHRLTSVGGERLNQFHRLPHDDLRDPSVFEAVQTFFRDLARRGRVQNAVTSRGALREHVLKDPTITATGLEATLAMLVLTKCLSVEPGDRLRLVPGFERNTLPSEALRSATRYQRSIPPMQRILDAVQSALNEDATADHEQPWISRGHDAVRVNSPLLQSSLVRAAHVAGDGDLSTACLMLCGCFEALRIHVQRYYRLARGSDAPRLERVLPAILSPTAQFAFPGHPQLHQEPKLAEDKYGAAALAHAGFTISMLAQFQRLVRITHPLQPVRDAPELLEEETLIDAHAALVERIVQLEQGERAMMVAFDAYEAVQAANIVVAEEHVHNAPFSSASYDAIEKLIDNGLLTAATEQLDALERATWSSLGPSDKFRHRRAQGRVLVRRGEANSAAARFMEAADFAPGDPNAKVLRARALMIRGEVAQAHELATSLVAEHPSLPSARSVWITSAPADRPTEELVAQPWDGLAPEIASALADRLLDSNRPREAVEVLQRAHSPGTRLEYWAAYSIALLKLQEQLGADTGPSELLDEALGALNSAYKLCAGEGLKEAKIQTLLNLGHVYRLRRDPDEEWRVLREARDVDPDNKDVRVRIAKLLTERGRLDEAVGIFEGLLADGPDYVPFLLGVALAQRGGDGDLRRSMDLFEQTARLAHPSEPVLRADGAGGVIQVARKLKEWDRALAACTEFSDVLGAFESKELEARIHIQRGDNEQAHRALLQLVRTAMTVDQQRALGVLLHQLGDNEQAFQTLAPVVRGDAWNDATAALLSVAQRTGRYETTIRICHDLKAAGITRTSIVDAEADALQRRGEIAAAIEVLRDALATQEDPWLRLRLSTLGVVASRPELVESDPRRLPNPRECDPHVAVVAVGVLRAGGAHDVAIRYAYDAYRTNRGVPDGWAAIIEAFKPMGGPANHVEPTVVSVDAAVLVVEGKTRRWVVVEASEPEAEHGELAPDSPMCAAMMGKKVGDAFEVARKSAPPRQYRIENIRSKYARANQICLDRWEEQFPGVPGPMVIEIPENAAENIDEFTKQVMPLLEARAQQVDVLDRLYRDKPVSFHMLARGLGGSVFGAMGHLVAETDLALRCNRADPEDATHVLELLNENRTLIIETTALSTLMLLDEVEPLISALAGRIAIAQSTIDEVMAHLREVETRGSGYMGLRNGRMIAGEISNESSAKYQDRLRALIHKVSQCEVFRESKHDHLTPDEWDRLVMIGGAGAVESLHRAMRTGDPIWSDDVVIAHVARERRVSVGWTQAVCHHLVTRSALDSERGNRISAKLVGWRYVSTNTTPGIFLEAARLARWNPEEWPLRQHLNLFEVEPWDDKSTLVLATNVVREWWSNAPSDTVANAVMGALLDRIARRKKGRALISEIERVLEQVFGVDVLTHERARSALEAWFRARSIRR
ncbi:MAG: GreA/GreB family elongation factor [Deltaproteobacteria bacterium]|nr:GreA/GreB family elongation factor [Deltaproteobacteria bacterium]